VGVHSLEATTNEMALADPVLRPVFPHREFTHLATAVRGFGGDPQFNINLTV